MDGMTLEQWEVRESVAVPSIPGSEKRFEARNINGGAEVTHNFDAKGIRMWVNSIVKNLLPHAAMICTHSIQHSFGYEVVQIVSNDIPQAYLDSITTPRNNVRSKIFSRLMASEGTIYLDAKKISNADQDCLPEFLLVGYANLIGYSYRTQGEFGRVTNVAFFKVDEESARNYCEIRHELMPALHAIFSGLANMVPGVLDIKSNQQQGLIARERRVADLVVQGKSNKEIARLLDMNERTAKQYVCNLMLKLNVTNRTALAVVLYKMLDGEATR